MLPKDSSCSRGLIIIITHNFIKRSMNKQRLTYARPMLPPCKNERPTSSTTHFHDTRIPSKTIFTSRAAWVILGYCGLCNNGPLTGWKGHQSTGLPTNRRFPLSAFELTWFRPLIWWPSSNALVGLLCRLIQTARGQDTITAKVGTIKNPYCVRSFWASAAILCMRKQSSIEIRHRTQIYFIID